MTAPTTPSNNAATTTPSDTAATTTPAKPEYRGLRLRDPFDFFEELREEMARLWGQRPLIPRTTFRLAEGIWAPRTDVFEKNDHVHIKVELPGMSKDDVKVEMHDGDLVIQGERKAENEVREEDYYRMERSYGTFYRRFPIPFEVKPDQIQASCKEGVLEVQIPKPAKAAPAPTTISVS
jgi:HSP20 family protein